MKYIHIFGLIVIFALFQACNDDEIGPSEPDIDLELIVLNHDGPNVDAPQLPANTYEAAVRFTASDLGIAVGGKLQEVHYFIQAPPDELEVRIYTGGTDTPGRLLYQQDVSRTIRASAWNQHTLPNPLTLNNDDLWIALRFRHRIDQRTLGCDPGPAVRDGDWLLDAADNSWLPLRQRAPISINWNIRAAVDR